MISQDLIKKTSQARRDPQEFEEGIKWALDQLRPKHTNKANFVIVAGLTSQIRMESGDMNMWIAGDKSLAIEPLKVRYPKYPVAQVVNAFLEKRCSDKFKDENHLWNAFKKFFESYKPEETKRGSVSPV